MGTENFILENKKGTKLTVSNVGAAVVSLVTRDSTGKLDDVVLGYENEQDYLNDTFYLGAVVGRYANRVAGDTVIIDHIPYKLPVREGGYHLHGGISGFNKKRFHVTALENKNGSGYSFEYCSPHLEEGYTLDENDNWTVEYKAVSDQTTLINLTQHSYFNLSGKLDTSIDDHELKINSAYFLPVNTMQVPTGALANVSATPFDFRTFKKMGADIHENNRQLQLSHGYDHSWVLEEKHTPSLKHAATVKETNSGRVLRVYTTEPAIHFYSGNFLNNVRGKKNTIYNIRCGFCLETQHFPDAPNHAEFPSTILKAHQEFYSKTGYQFSTL
jgi:aldose 1-epimerase